MADLSKLKKINRELDDMVENEKNNRIIYQTNGDGTFLGFGLWKEREIAIQRVFMSKGTKIPEHQHKQDEYVLVYIGSYELCYNDKIYVKNVGDFTHILPNRKHGGRMLEDSWIISITVPAGEGYPDA